MLRTVLFLAAMVPATAQAAEVVSQIGTPVVKANGQRLADGEFTGDAVFNNSADPAPFDRQSGRDSGPANFSVQWVQTYAPLVEPVSAAVLELGIWDVDGDVAGDQVGLFSINGVDLTGALNAVVNAKTFTGDGRYGIYDLALPSSTYAVLVPGALSFRLDLSGPARNVLGATAFNGGILDYSRLTITTSAVVPPTPAVPEAATWATMILGLGAVGVALRRRRGVVDTARAIAA